MSNQKRKPTEKFLEVYNQLKSLQLINTDSGFAKSIDTSSGMVSDILTGKREASINLLINLMDAFNINANFLFRDDPQMFYLKNDIKPPVSGDGIVSVTVDETGKENVLYVPIRAYASYIQSFNDPVYLKDMIAFKAPFLSYHGVRVFEVKGNSMEKPSGEGIHEGDSLWCTQIYKHQDIYNGRVHVVWTDDTAYVKRVTWNEGNDYLTLRSDNPETKTFRLPLDEVKQLYYAHVHFNFHMPPPGTVDDKLAQLEIRLSDQEKSHLKLLNQLKGLLGGTTEL